MCTTSGFANVWYGRCRMIRKSVFFFLLGVCNGLNIKVDLVWAAHNNIFISYDFLLSLSLFFTYFVIAGFEEKRNFSRTNFWVAVVIAICCAKRWMSCRTLCLVAIGWGHEVDLFQFQLLSRILPCHKENFTSFTGKRVMCGKR